MSGTKTNNVREPSKATVDDMVEAVRGIGQPCTKKEIADQTGVTRQTIANHESQLESDPRVVSAQVGAAKAYWLAGNDRGLDPRMVEVFLFGGLTIGMVGTLFAQWAIVLLIGDSPFEALAGTTALTPIVLLTMYVLVRWLIKRTIGFRRERPTKMIQTEAEV